MTKVLVEEAEYTIVGEPSIDNNFLVAFIQETDSSSNYLLLDVKLSMLHQFRTNKKHCTLRASPKDDTSAIFIDFQRRSGDLILYFSDSAAMHEVDQLFSSSKEISSEVPPNEVEKKNAQRVTRSTTTKLNASSTSKLGAERRPLAQRKLSDTASVSRRKTLPVVKTYRRAKTPRFNSIPPDPQPSEEFKFVKAVGAKPPLLKAATIEQRRILPLEKEQRGEVVVASVDFDSPPWEATKITLPAKPKAATLKRFRDNDEEYLPTEGRAGLRRRTINNDKRKSKPITRTSPRAKAGQVGDCQGTLGDLITEKPQDEIEDDQELNSTVHTARGKKSVLSIGGRQPAAFQLEVPESPKIEPKKLIVQPNGSPAFDEDQDQGSFESLTILEPQDEDNQGTLFLEPNVMKWRPDSPKVNSFQLKSSLRRRDTLDALLEEDSDPSQEQPKNDICQLDSKISLPEAVIDLERRQSMPAVSEMTDTSFSRFQEQLRQKGILLESPETVGDRSSQSYDLNISDSDSDSELEPENDSSQTQISVHQRSVRDSLYEISEVYLMVHH